MPLLPVMLSKSNRFEAILLRSPSAATPGRPGGRAADAAAEAIAGAAKLVTRIRSDARLTALLETNGFRASAVDAGIALLTAAEEQFNLFERVYVACEAVRRERDAMWINAREEYLEFRATVRAGPLAAAQRRRLRMGAVVRNAVPEFVAQASASYCAAEAIGVAPLLAERSFGETRIAEARELLRQLEELDRLVRAGETKLHRQADERDLAVGMLNLWVGELLQSFRLALGSTARPRRSFTPGLRHSAMAGRLRRRVNVSRRRLPPRLPPFGDER